MRLASIVSLVLAWLCVFTTPYFINRAELGWGPKYGYIWFRSGLIVIAFVHYMPPKARRRSLEEINEMSRNRVPTRHFKKYVCVEIEEARKKGALNALSLGKEKGTKGSYPRHRSKTSLELGLPGSC